jgi:bifunctional enzyme CysN/CysC
MPRSTGRPDHTSGWPDPQLTKEHDHGTFIRPDRTDIEAYLQQHQHKSLLRFITCGSVDDGKSTLIGRLLYESRCSSRTSSPPRGRLSKKWGTQGGDIDFALLVDGLAAEREQGITIDVAYRFFSTDKRKFIVADTPGHEQYTRNMVTGASTADVASSSSTRARACSRRPAATATSCTLLGIRNLVVAINKMDLVDYSIRPPSTRSRPTTASSPSRSALDDITVIPLSALKGDNIVSPARDMPWYHGPTLMGAPRDGRGRRPTPATDPSACRCSG